MIVNDSILHVKRPKSNKAGYNLVKVSFIHIMVIFYRGYSYYQSGDLGGDYCWSQTHSRLQEKTQTNNGKMLIFVSSRNADRYWQEVTWLGSCQTTFKFIGDDSHKTRKLREAWKNISKYIRIFVSKSRIGFRSNKQMNFSNSKRDG